MSRHALSGTLSPPDGALHPSGNLPRPGRTRQFLALCLLTAVSLQPAFSQTGTEVKEAERQGLELERTIAEFMYSRFEPSDLRYKKVYQTGREIYSLEIYQGMYADIYHNFGFTAEIRRYAKKGHATLTQESTQLLLVPVGIGVRYVLNIDHFVPWIEVGADYVSYTETSDLRSTSGSTLGYHLQAGFYLETPGLESLKIKISIRHSKAPTEENGIRIDLGGVEYGIGLALGINLF